MKIVSSVLCEKGKRIKTLGSFSSNNHGGINISSLSLFLNDLITLENLHTKPLLNGLHHSFIDKNKYVKRNLAVELEYLTSKVDKFVLAEDKENFHEYNRSTTNLFTENVYKSSDKTFAALKQLRENKDIVILNGDKDSSVVIMSKLNYTNKINNMMKVS